jgi:hypothetical protein
LKQLIQFCTECMQEYLHNACHTFFATTTSPHCKNSTQSRQQQTNMEAGTWGNGGVKPGNHTRPHPFIHSLIRSSIHSIRIYRNPHLMSSPMKQGKTNSRHLRSPTQTEGLHTMGCGLVPQGTYNGTKLNFHDSWFNHGIVIIN